MFVRGKDAVRAGQGWEGKASCGGIRVQTVDSTTASSKDKDKEISWNLRPSLIHSVLAKLRSDMGWGLWDGSPVDYGTTPQG